MTRATSSASAITSSASRIEAGSALRLLREALGGGDAPAVSAAARALAAAAARDARLARSRVAVDAWAAEVEGLERARADLREVLIARGRRIAALCACDLPPDAAADPAPIAPEDDVRRLRGVGPATAAALAARGVRTIADLLYLLPRRYEDRRNPRPIAELRDGDEATVRGRVAGVRGWFRRLVVGLDDGTGRLDLVWFRRTGMWARIARGGAYVATGVARAYEGRLQMAHPDLVPDDGRAPAVRVRYPEIEGVAPRALERLVRQACDGHLDRVADGVPAEVAARLGLPGQVEALRAIHDVPPDAPAAQVAALEAGRTPAHERLVFDEIFFLQLGLDRRRRADRRDGAPACAAGPDALARLRAALPFRLTAAQARVIGEIRADLARETPMNRLLQGDVGSGKTVVALAAAEMAMAAGRQAALMAPTELLAEQHDRSLAPVLGRLGRRAALLTASTPRPARESLLALLEAGQIDLLVGTHALLTRRVAFADLGVCVIDEQHRFGVAQRASLRAHGERVPHLLVMTATPIPRTLALTVYGGLDVSVIDELPPGRRPPETRVLAESRRKEAYALIGEHARAGGCAYVVCPLVEESEDIDLVDAVSTHEALRRAAPGLRLALVTGRTPAHEREEIVARLRRGEVDALVSTTLIEVGLDLPQATLVIVEHAERFGLAQLHQMRGRVGRGERAGLCVLLTAAEPGTTARRRVETLAATTDGFRIAEADLEFRGPGEIFGTKQAGLPRLRFADLGRHVRFVAAARDEAGRLLDEDPGLARHETTRRVLDDRWAETALYGEEAG